MTNPVQILTVNGKNIDGVLGIRIQDRTLVGAYEATELWWPTIIDCNQRNQIGQFSSVFGNKFCYKSSPNIWKTVWAFLKSITFKVISECLQGDFYSLPLSEHLFSVFCRRFQSFDLLPLPENVLQTILSQKLDGNLFF